MLSKQKRRVAAEASAAAQAEAAAPSRPEERIEDYLAVDPMEIEIGVGLIRLADPSRGGDLLPRITGVRQAVASDIGIVLPKVRIRDNMRLAENQYRIKIANNPVAEGTVYPDKLLAMDSGMTTGTVPGEETRDPAFQQPAVWIEQGLRDRAEMLGYTPVEPAAVLATHLQEVVRKHADELLTRDATKHLIDELRQVSPAVVDELIPGVMKLGEVQQVLQLLLREQVPIRQLGVILETLGDYAAAHQGSHLADRVRPPSPGPDALHAVPRRGEPAVRRHARSGAWRIGLRRASSTTSGGCSSACRRRRSRRPAR